jgi:hypothetical protein
MAPTEDSPMGKRLNCPDCPKIESAKPHKRRYSDYSGLPGIGPTPKKLKPPQRVSQGGYRLPQFLRCATEKSGLFMGTTLPPATDY